METLDQEIVKKNGRGKPAKVAKPEAGTTVSLPKIDFRVAVVKIGGISPLIVHAWSEKAKEMMRAKQTKQARVTREAKSPEDDYKSSKYINSKGQECIPASGIRNAIISAGRFSEGTPMTIIRGSIFILADEDLVPLEDYTVSMREDMVRIGGKGPGTGVADIRYRACYNTWTATLRIQFNANTMSLVQVLNLVQLAGMSVGLCEWRPEKNGQNGRFDIIGEAQEYSGEAARAMVKR